MNGDAEACLLQYSGTVRMLILHGRRIGTLK